MGRLIDIPEEKAFSESKTYDPNKVVEQLEKEFKKYYGENWNKAPFGQSNRDSKGRWNRCENRFLNLLENLCTRNTTVTVLTVAVRYRRKVLM